MWFWFWLCWLYLTFSVRDIGCLSAGFVLLDAVEGTAWEDLGQGGNANDWYYRVVAVNPCGEEGP